MSQENRYGNLQAYKMYIRPTANKMYGTSFSKISSLTIHQQTIRNMLSIMAKNESLTIWDMAKIKFANDVSKLRYREKKYRRLLVGREDRGKHSSGLLDLGLVLKDGKSFKKIPADKYRLSLHGLLYSIDSLQMNESEIDLVAKKYAMVLPRIFDKWDYLKSKIGSDVYTIRLLARGLIADNPQIITNSQSPFYELMSYITIKYQRNFENISEKDLANQVSYWFYVNLLYTPFTKKKNSYQGMQKLEYVFQDDANLRKWFFEFFREAKQYYKNRYDVMKIKVTKPIH